MSEHDEIRQRLSAVRGWPFGVTIGEGRIWVNGFGRDVAVAEICPMEGREDLREPIAEMFANAATDIDTLLAECERLKADLAQAEFLQTCLRQARNKADAKRDEIRAMLAALNLPWKFDSEEFMPVARDANNKIVAMGLNAGVDRAGKAHARFIAAAPGIVKDLLDECERLTRERDDARLLAFEESQKVPSEQERKAHDIIDRFHDLLTRRLKEAEAERDEARAYVEILKSAAEKEMQTLRAELARAQETIAMMGVQAK